MLKKSLLFFLLIPIIFLFANDNETYIIKVKGDFAKELKELVEKYEGGSGSVEVISEKELQLKNSPIEQAIKEQIKIDSTNPTQQDKQEIYNRYFSDEPTVRRQQGDILKGKKIYDNACYRCHGAEAEKSKYGSARDLNKISENEIFEQLKNYSRDSGYGKQTGIIMRMEAGKLSSFDMRSVAAYIQTLKQDK